MDILDVNKNNEYENKIAELKYALKHTKNVRLYKSYSVVLKHFDGFTNKKIAEMENIEVHTVGIYIKNYKSKRLSGLNIGHGGGATKKLMKNKKK